MDRLISLKERQVFPGDKDVSVEFLGFELSDLQELDISEAKEEDSWMDVGKEKDRLLALYTIEGIEGIMSGKYDDLSVEDLSKKNSVVMAKGRYSEGGREYFIIPEQRYRRFRANYRSNDFKLYQWTY